MRLVIETQPASPVARPDNSYPFARPAPNGRTRKARL